MTTTYNWAWKLKACFGYATFIWLFIVNSFYIMLNNNASLEAEVIKMVFVGKPSILE